MNDSIEFTPKEKYQISLYNDPNGLFWRTVLRSLRYLIPSILMVAYYIWSDDVAVGAVGYGLLLFQAVYRLGALKNALYVTAAIHRKYEAQLQMLRERCPSNS